MPRLRVFFLVLEYTCSSSSGSDQHFWSHMLWRTKLNTLRKLDHLDELWIRLPFVHLDWVLAIILCHKSVQHFKQNKIIESFQKYFQYFIKDVKKLLAYSRGAQNDNLSVWIGKNPLVVDEREKFSIHRDFAECSRLFISHCKQIFPPRATLYCPANN